MTQSLGAGIVGHVVFRLLRHPSMGLMALALLAGGLAVLVAKHYLAQQEQVLRQAAERPQRERVVASVELQPGVVLLADHLAYRLFPADLVPSDSVDATRFDALLGKVVMQPLQAGDLITRAHVQDAAGPFSEQLLSGRRAVTVPVDALSSVSGLIRPGDLIDLYVSFDDRQRRVTAPVLQSVSVLATGQRSRDDADSLSGDSQGYSTLTLDVGPDEALKLLAARQHGRITALLRHPDDQTPHQAAVRGELADILGLSGGGLPSRPIEVLYGNRPARPSADPEQERLGWLDFPLAPSGVTP